MVLSVYLPTKLQKFHILQNTDNNIATTLLVKKFITHLFYSSALGAHIENSNALYRHLSNAYKTHINIFFHPQNLHISIFFHIFA